MPQGVTDQYLEPEHAAKLRELGEGGLACTPTTFYPSKEQPPLPHVYDGKGSELIKGDKVLYEGDIRWVHAVDVRAKKVDIGLRRKVLATACVGRVRNMEELVEDGLLPEQILSHSGYYRQYRDRLYDATRRPRATHRDYRFSGNGRRHDRSRENERRLESHARQKDEDESDDDVSRPHADRHARYGAKLVAAVKKKCACGSGLDREWCTGCGRRDSGKAAQKLGVLAPLHGKMSDESFVALRGMSREDFDRYRLAFLHPAPPDLVEALLEAQRMLGGRPVRALEDEDTYPKWKVFQDMGMGFGFGFKADGKTPNAATRAVCGFPEVEPMFWQDNADKGGRWHRSWGALRLERPTSVSGPR